MGFLFMQRVLLVLFVLVVAAGAANHYLGSPISLRGVDMPESMINTAYAQKWTAPQAQRQPAH
jgi:hypothetical protein